ncbi:helix-turn-helix transcriptional regulator [Embleya sp. NPDC005575]|uniref:helix-turn-helix domain-containing protein n=1 Tax=Embleya sp. NPDC005575 TaxID=3156892 RepID=UPI0033A4A6BB
MALGPTTRRRLLATELRRLRDRKGLTLEEAGAAVGHSRATVNRYENNTGSVRWVVVEALCRAYGATDAECEAAVLLAKDAKVQGWWKGITDAIPAWLTPLFTLEDEALELCAFATSYVPGLLQTRAYADAVHRATETHATEDQLARMVEVRMRRQDILKRENPPHLRIVLDEAVIRRAVGRPETMAGQLDHLLTCSERSYITIQILPFAAGAYADTTGFIYIKGQDPSLDVVYVGSLAGVGALYVEKSVDLERHRTVFNHLTTQAINPEESTKMITEVRDFFALNGNKRSA